MTVKEKLKQEEEKLLESVNNSYRDMMRAQFDCIFEELEERCEKVRNMQRGCYCPIRVSHAA